MAQPASPARPSSPLHPPPSPAMAHPRDICEWRRPHFFKVFFPCDSSRRLGIPPGFWKHIQHETSRGVFLIGPSGNVWNADLVRDNNGGISFQNGWEEFVADHTLKTGDFLLFRYDGGLCFTVMVFDPTACEKEDAFHVMPCEDVMILGESRPRWCATECSAEDLIILDPNTDMAIPSKSMGGTENPLEATCRDFVKKHTNSVESHSDERLHTNDVSMVATEDIMDWCGERDSVLAPQTGPSTSLRNLQPECVESTGGNLNKRRECILMAKGGVHSRNTPRHSLCKKSLNSSRFSRWKQSSRCHLDNVTCVVKEEPQSDEDIDNAYSGETMLKHKRITKTKADKSHNLCGGGFKESAQKHKELAVKPSIHKKNRSAKRQPCCKRSRSSANSKIDNVTIAVRMGYAVSRRRPITEYDKAKTLEAAMLFKSEHPFSICIMQESNVYYGYYMCLPISFIKHLPKSSVKMRLWGPSNEPWRVMYVHCKGRGGFSAGWGKFVRAHNLESDDVCVFELFKPDEVRVHIFRVVEEIIPLIWSDCRTEERICH